MASFLMVMITCPNRAMAQRLGRALVERELAACVNVVPGIMSIFRWQGRVERSREVLVIAKTTGARFERLRRAVCALHPYKVPEVIAVPIRRGHRPYLAWIGQSVTRASRRNRR